VTGPAGPRFSVVIPTFQRRELVLAAVRALAGQDFAGRFEAVVVVDGSRDGTAEALRRLDPAFPLAVLEQENQGAAAARNRGAEVARGEILLFLDDDMEAHPRLLAEHDRSHREGADAVLGHIPLHPGSPPGFLAAAVGRWAEERLRTLSAPDARLALHDLLTGQLSLRRDLFERMEKFDEAFTAGGSYGDEDLDFGHRLLAGGWRVVFNPEAVSWQRYVVTPRQHLRQWRQTGRADVAFARKHPERAADLFAHQQRRMPRLWRPVVEVPGLGAVLATLARGPVLLLGAAGKRPTLAFRLFRWLRGIEYWRGVREGGGIPRPRPLRILAWHAVADLDGDRVIGDYSVPPALFRKQIGDLERAGCRFVTPGEALRCLEGNGGLPRRPVLLTFDDGYADLEETVRPILEERRAPAVAFAVSRRLGGSNEWDQAIGAGALPLLDAAGLRELRRGGIEIGAHSRTHRRLVKIPEEEIREEVAGSRADLEAAGLPAPRLFAYPYGERNAAARAAAREAGYAAAFTVDPGLARPGGDRFQVPRIEVLRRDRGWSFLWKVARAGR
jgi:peptidoglycan/xylan/chitin deacetylase (PgdA/CDA1 family)/GT2 family glycosyltransferase